MELKIQSNQDIREKSNQPSASSPGKEAAKPSFPSEEKNKTPTSATPPGGSLFQPVEDIRFRQAATSANTSSSNNVQSRFKPLQSTASRAKKQNNQKNFYNPGQPRTYLSDRHLRNVDVRELSSKVSHGYQYPAPAEQSIGPKKKVPEGFHRPQNPAKPPSQS